MKVIGYTDLPGRLPTQSSQLYGTNLVNLLKLLCKEKDGNIDVDFDDVVIRGVTVIRGRRHYLACAANPGFRAATGRALKQHLRQKSRKSPLHPGGSMR
ncbi:pyridine nucleotide transhydrogenase subunit-alpha [Salmonella enterica subsp. arizonae]|uniref:proton-translocating NAD(P)(+) transhydrogenase n=1 Tax=Salmonella enterica subsp. arizonae TaxID=59203 RepID=A0A379S5D2_SALER|nr:pyridine nucleotide transhydrogenase subunit-alpha [Salmonella enterica subsp. arizonae]